MPRGLDSTSVFPDPAPVYIHSSQGEEALANLRRSCADRNRIHHAFHYATPRQSSLWRRVFESHSPVLQDKAFVDIYHEVYANLPSENMSSYVHVVGLGPGTGIKERWLMDELDRRGIDFRFTAVDVSPALCLAAGKTNAPLFSIGKGLMICCDLLQFTDLPQWLDKHDAGAQRIYTFFGLTPNFSPVEAFPYLHSLLRSDDIILCNAHLAPGIQREEADYIAGVEAVLPQYDNDETRAWLQVALEDWGWLPHLEPLTIEPSEFANGLRGVRAHTTWAKDVELDWEGSVITKTEGTPLDVFFSLRYTPARFEAELKANNLGSWLRLITPCREEGVWIVQKARL